jgi:hypothetical protein
MSYLRHLDACNRFEPARFLPLLVAGTRLGFVRRDNAKALADYPNSFLVGNDSVTVSPHLTKPAALTEVFGEAAAKLAQRGAIPGLRGELFAISRRWGEPALFELDRGAVPFFGTRSYGAHLNGWASDRELWIGKRADGKMVAPGKLDNLVAGGIGSGYGAWETLLKEAHEEADIPQDVASRARPAGAIVYRMEQADGMRDDTLFVYDLALPAGFTPKSNDGEMQSFRRMTLDECLRVVAETDDFKFNVNLVLLDLALRQGAIAPEHPDFMALVTGLRGGLVREAGPGANLGG